MKTTHKIPPKKKENLFKNNYELIQLVYKFGNGMMLRSQIRQLYIQIYEENYIDIDFRIAELINNCFLLPKKICKNSKTELLYLNKYCVSRFLNMKSGNVAAIAFSNQKIFENIFKTEYLIHFIIPEMQKQNFVIGVENIETYLNYTCCNILLRPNQLSAYEFYQRFSSVAGELFEITDDFYRDMNIAYSEKYLFVRNRLKKQVTEPILYTDEKSIRNSIRASYKSETERNKQFYNFSSFMGHRFFIEKIERDKIYIIYFDTLNTLTLNKLYPNLVFTYLMLQRYLNKSQLALDVTIYTWNENRCLELSNAEKRRVFDISKQEYRDTNRRETYFSNLGVRQITENINVNYEYFDIEIKYDININ